MPNQFLSPEGDLENYFVTEYWLIDQYVGDELLTWGYGFTGAIGNGNLNSNQSIPVTTFAGGTNWKQASVARDATAAVKTDGTLWTWGSGGNGVLGTNDLTTRSTPVTTFAGGTDWKQVSLKNYHAAAIKTDGTLWTWGRGSYGRLGTNDTTNRSTPVTTFAGGTNWKQVSCGYDFTTAIKTDGTLWTWGQYGNGGLGILVENNIRSTPVTTFAGGTNWADTATTEPEDLYTLSAGIRHTVAIKTDGTLWSWGYGYRGQLGNNNTTARSTPVTTFTGETNWKQVSAGFLHTAAIKTDGTLWSWGFGNYGQLGTNDTTNRSTPVTTFAGGTNWKQVSAGSKYTAAIKTDGTLWTWGYDSYGQLGINSIFPNRFTPVTTFAGGTNWKQVSTGGTYTAAIKTDGTLWTWGNGSSGQLGFATENNIRSTPVTTFAGGTNWADTATTEPEDLYTLSAGNRYTAAIKTDGTLWTWGNGLNGVLGNNDTYGAINTVNRSTPVTTFAGGTNWKQVSTGRTHTAAIKTDGTLWTWGNGNYGQLGTNDTIARSTPVTTFAGGTNWKQVSTGRSNAAAIKTDGTLWTWGINFNGQLGTNDATQRNTPTTTFAGGTNWKQVSTGGNHMTAIKTDGTLWTWGDGYSGQLGTAITGFIFTRTPVTTFAGGTNWKQVDCGDSYTAAIKTDGTLWTWGYGGDGSLGNNNITKRNIPVTTFAGGTDWKQVSSGYRHTAAIKTDGTLWSWGNGLNGRLGTNDTTSRSTPVTTFAGGTNWKQVSAGYEHTVALRDDGVNKELYAFGSNINNELGINIRYFDLVSSPVTTFAGGTNWKQVDCGGFHTVAIKTDGTLWTWGYGYRGQLGTNDTTPRKTPVTTFAGGTNWKQVSAGGIYTAAIKTDGTLWTWGNNSDGQLGTNNTSSGSTPVTTFAGGTNWKQVSAGAQHTVALRDDGVNKELYVWGSNISYPVLGINSVIPNNISTPVTTFAGGTNWKQVSSGDRHTAAIKTDGTLWTWGRGFQGELGTNDTTTRSTPVTTFAGGTNWKQVSSGRVHTATIKTDGTLWTWGENLPILLATFTDTGTSGVCNTISQISGTTTFFPSPNSGTRITTSSGTGTVTSITNSLLGAASLTSATTPFTGGNDDGFWNLTLPFNISYNGTTHSTIYVGTNSYITFGAGSTQYSSLSFSNPALEKIMISSRDNSAQRIYYGTEGTAPNRTYRVRWEGSTSTSGTLGSPTMLWEAVFYENVNDQIDIQVGVNNRMTSLVRSLTPVTTFAGGTNWKQVSSGSFHTAAIKTDGTLWTWGNGLNGRLGTNDTTSRSTPVTTFFGGTNWKLIDSGYNRIAAVTAGINVVYPLS